MSRFKIEHDSEEEKLLLSLGFQEGKYRRFFIWGNNKQTRITYTRWGAIWIDRMENKYQTKEGKEEFRHIVLWYDCKEDFNKEFIRQLIKSMELKYVTE